MVNTTDRIYETQLLLAEIVSGSAVFAAAVSADYASIRISDSQAAHYVTVDAALQGAYRAGTTSETRTSVAVRRMKDAIKLVQREAQLLAKIIYATQTVSDAQSITLGLLPRATYTRRTGSTEPPVVQVVSVVGRVVRIRLRGQPSEGGRRGIGALGAQVYSFVGDPPPTDARGYHHEGVATRETYQIVFPNDVPGGATAWVSAAWVSPRGMTSSACTPVKPDHPRRPGARERGVAVARAPRRWHPRLEPQTHG
jgi:hypothetical protein